MLSNSFVAKLYWVFILICVVFLFRTMFNQFFSADDWFHLRISSINTVQQFSNFFSFPQTEQSAAFYRPLPTQVFFFAMRGLFGLNALWWYVAVLASFMACLYVLFLLVQYLSNTTTARISTFLYAISHTNSTRLYFLSAYQEVLLVLFSVLSVYGFAKRNNARWHVLSLVCFWLALLSKETAVVIPGLLGLVLIWEVMPQKSIQIKTLIPTYLRTTWPFLLSLGVYLMLRFAVFGFSATSHDSYQLSFQPTQIANTIMWYGLWAVGAPETLVNYVANFRVLDRWWSDFPALATPSLSLLLTSLLGLGGLLVAHASKHIRKKSKKLQTNCILIVFSIGWFFLTLLPVLFFPNHKFALELGLPLVGSSLVAAILIAENRRVGWFVLATLFALNTASAHLTATTHYSVLRSKTSERVYKYFTENHPSLPDSTVVSFTNDRTDLPTNWGVSKQVSESLQGSEFFAVLYPGKSVLAEYADLPHTKLMESTKLMVGSAQFLE